MLPLGGSEHGWVIMNVATALALFVKTHHLGCVFARRLVSSSNAILIQSALLMSPSSAVIV